MVTKAASNPPRRRRFSESEYRLVPPNPQAALPGAAATGDFFTPLPLCPDGYYFRYDYQACFPDGVVPPPLSTDEWYKHACDCPPNESLMIGGPLDRTCKPWGWLAGTPGAELVPTLPVHSGGCPTGSVWDPVLQLCKEGKPVPDDFENWCPGLHDPEISWYAPLPLDCTSESWKNRINDGFQWSYRRLEPAYRMLNAMWEGDHFFRTCMWSAGLGSVDEVIHAHSEDLEDEILDPSLARWFGHYDEYKLLLITHAVWYAMVRISEPPYIHIRCHNANVCGGAPAYTTAASSGVHPGTIHLCKNWKEETGVFTEHRRLILLHELLHWAFPFWITNTPRDIIEDGCEWEGSHKCYQAINAAFLADNTQITRNFYDQELSESITLPAAVANVDNYTSWLRGRFGAWGTCTFPSVAGVPLCPQ